MSSSPPERASARILIADDLPDLLQALKETLEREGFHVTAVGDGQAALDEIRREPPDIAVLDFRMPKMTGFEVCAALRADMVERCHDGADGIGAPAVVKRLLSGLIHSIHAYDLAKSPRHIVIGAAILRRGENLLRRTYFDELARRR